MEKSARNPRRSLRGVHFGVSNKKSGTKVACRIMCSPLIGTARTRFSNPHQLTWSSLQARSAAAQEEPFLDTLIGGLAFAGLFLALAFI